MYGLVQVTAPTLEPVSLAEARNWLRFDDGDDDQALAGVLRAARKAVEELAGRQLVTATWRMSLDTWPGTTSRNGVVRPLGASWLRLPKAPLQAVSSVKYLDGAGVEQTLDPSVYEVDAAHDPGRLRLAYSQVWPVAKVAMQAIRIEFVAGFGTPNKVPDTYKTAILMTAASWMIKRGDREGGAGAVYSREPALPGAALALLDLEGNGERMYG